MSGHDVEITVKCNECESPVLIDIHGPSNDTIVTCQSCGTPLGRLGDLKAAIDKAAIEAAVTEPLERMLKGLDGFTVKKE
jgi:ribosomal protein S27E